MAFYSTDEVLVSVKPDWNNEKVYKKKEGSESRQAKPSIE